MNIRIGIFAVAALAGVAQADVDWVDWQSATSTSVTGIANGITATYSGGFQFAQTSSNTNYWIPSAPYISATVPNAPPDSDIIALAHVGGTLSFSQAVTDPIMAIVSLGQPGIGSKWHFDAPFQIVSQGAGYWGSGPLINPIGNTLQGNEGHGVIQFKGTFTSISWEITEGENWAGFTVAVPSPGSAAALAAGLLPALRRRRR